MRCAVLLTLSIALLFMAGTALAHGGHHGGPSPVAADPDLLSRLGPAAVAKLAGGGEPEADLYRLTLAEIAAGKSAKVTGTGSCLLILFQWTDHPADGVAHPGSAYNDMMFSAGTYATGSVNDFYLENSYGQYGVTGLASGWHTSSGLYAAFAPTDYGQVRDMIAAAVAQLDPVIDYSQYDNDGPDGVPDSGDDDGYVDALFFVHAGPGREQTGDDNDIWSHAWAFYGGLSTGDGVGIYRYSVEPEMLSDGAQITIGVFAHEYGHVLGLPDLYDTDYSTSGIGDWGLMSGGSWCRRSGDPVGSSPAHLTAWSKWKLGWLTPNVVTADQLGATLPPVETSAVAYRIFRGGATAGDEFFLVENRQPIGFDGGLTRRQVDLGLPQPQGMIITHVDESMSANSNDNHRLVDIVEASPWFHAPGDWMEHLDGPRDYALQLWLDQYNRGDNGDAWPGWSTASLDSTDWIGPRDRDRFADDTIPPAEDYFCDASGIAIENIALAGQDVTADFLVGAKRLPAVSPDKSLTWTFETDSEGWLFCRGYVHHDLTQGGSCGGAGGLWFGLDDADYVCPPGYGNNWNDFTWRTVGVSDGATVSLRHRYDLEVGYDFARLEVRCAGDPEVAWYEIASFGGYSDCVTDTWAIPTSAISACANAFGFAVLDLRLRLDSDEGWSAEDGGYCGIGWWVDEITITGEYAVGVGDLPGAGLPAMLRPASPNPFNPVTALKYHVPAGAREVGLSVYDQRGRLVRDLSASPEAGWQERSWDGRDETGRNLPSGIYFARLNVDGALRIQKLALLK
ncbi:M6 family metalloprotease domain-containing protein [bacterium]|nr:M6 family metalloprotease domain-containing protein [bacterium]MBU1073705.1 M6 family metalloprotease domain-containing protein [bacterium]MBU1675435.1 M6 family metalloprotease domain-containing protein [bacterium]